MLSDQTFWIGALAGLLFMAFIWPVLAGIMFRRNSKTAEE